MKVLVTGGTGFTGGHVCGRLVREGHEVRAFVRDPARCSRLYEWGVDLAIGDLRDSTSIERAMQGVEAVYHIAALFRPENVSRRDMWEANVQGTQYMLEAAVKAGVRRFVHCSTVGVHGHIKHPPGNEETPYGPGDHYQESKAEAERIVWRYITEERLPVVIFRPAGIYGPRDMRFLKLFKAIRARKFAMLGSGQVMFHTVYIDDLVDGILLCGSKDNALGNVYILAGDEPVTLNQLVRTIAEVLGVSPPRLHFPFMPVYLAGLACEILCKPLGINPPLYRRRVDFFRKTRSFDIAKAKRELGYEPKTDLRTGLSLTANWYRKTGLL
jgi:nucleoside-diphosphate-sugar epimerase